MLIIEQQHALGGRLDPLVYGSRHFADRLEEHLARSRWQHRGGATHTSGKLGQGPSSRSFEQLEQKGWAPRLASQGHKVLQVGQELRPSVTCPARLWCQPLPSTGAYNHFLEIRSYILTPIPCLSGRDHSRLPANV